MYPWFRIINIIRKTRRQDDFKPGQESRLSMRCLPGDIDTNLHINNGRYLTLADVGRFQQFRQSGIWGIAMKNGWAPMLGGVQVAFTREIRLWQRFELRSSIETWEDTQVLGRHRFILPDGRIAAVLMTTGGIYDKKAGRFVLVDEAFAALGRDFHPRPPNEEERAFMRSHGNLRLMGKQSLNGGSAEEPVSWN